MYLNTLCSEGCVGFAGVGRLRREVKWSEVKWIWRFSCAHREIMWIVGIAPRVLISALCGDAPATLRSEMSSRYPWNRKLGGNHSRSGRFGDEGNFMWNRTTISRLLSLLAQTQYWLLCYGSGCCPFWESIYFTRVSLSRVIVFMICKLTRYSPVVTVCTAACSVRRTHWGRILYLCISCGSEDTHRLWSQKGLNYYFNGNSLCSLWGRILRNIYEGWNFNSGNYLFTTDTK